MLSDWQLLMDPAHAPLREAAARVDPTRPADVEGLRRAFTADLVGLALELARARGKARAKYAPEVASSLVADVPGVEQASGGLVAEHKAARFARATPGRILDLCCGIGGDAMSLARVAQVVAWDLDPVRAWMCGQNAGCATRCQDVTELELEDAEADLWHLDPSRRDESTGRRNWHYEDYRPAPAFIARLMDEHPDGALKLGPGVELDALPLPRESEVELVSEGGKLVQTVLWGGRLAETPGARRATMLPSGETMVGRPSHAPCVPGGAVLGYLFQADPAVERAGLLGALAESTGLAEVFPGLGLLTGASPVASSWLTSFEVLAVLPWREKKIRKSLRELDAGVVELRNRGHAVDAPSAQRALQGSGSRPLIVYALRCGRAVRAVIAQRVGTGIA